MKEILFVLLFSSASVVYLFIISKLLGKKQISQLDFVDYVIGISIGSIAAEMATDISDKPIYYYLIAITIFFLFDVVVTFLGRKTTPLKKLFKGRPIVIIKNGEIDYKELKKSKLDFYDLVALCREQNYFDLNDIAFAVFETSGNMSILPKSEQIPVVAKDFGIENEKSTMTDYLIVDGEIIKDSLISIDKDKNWLINKLNITHKKQLKPILYAYYDEQNDNMIVKYKKSLE